MMITLFRKTMAFLCAFIACSTLVSCDGWIYQDEGDCDPHFKVKFRYDYHLKGGNAFPNEVNAVTLYIIDPETGNVVWRKTENSDSLKNEDYVMDIEGLAPGNYKLMAWAGDGHRGSEHFTLADTGNDHTEFRCTLNREHAADGTAQVSAPLHRLYKDLPQEFSVREFPDRQGTHVHTVRLMKNTNHITVVLQHLSGEPVDPKAFTYTITDNNGIMDYDNSLIDDETISYTPNIYRTGISAGFVPENMAQAQFSAAIVEFDVARMMADHKMYLTINRVSDGGLVAKVPVIDYALMVKGNYGTMPDQEYLDRQDQYSMVFFIDEGLRWINTMIYINSWMIVPNITDL
ncbi:MAG: FimB/Mfa2 family fimbrial subunit [Firmicutes bacterium]|nr:FimB/Mfa2 family fimbrial subunit [Bacillota bacterium]MCM1401768.1 FimB/Mfa2 family fimbrial subunit [Bacteroides sp.]MCM1477915.1 FimB/Mfa2 family fimbrial subunit [Bacteroides sp.]